MPNYRTFGPQCPKVLNTPESRIAISFLGMKLKIVLTVVVYIFFFPTLITSFNGKSISSSQLSHKQTALWIRWCVTWISGFSAQTPKVYLHLCCYRIKILGVSVTSCLFQSMFYHFKYFFPGNFIVLPLQAHLFVWLDTSLQDKILSDRGRCAQLRKLKLQTPTWEGHFLEGAQQQLPVFL